MRYRDAGRLQRKAANYLGHFTRLKSGHFTRPLTVMVRMASEESRDAQRATGIAIARESIEAVRSRVRGVQVSAPFGNVETALKVIL